MDDDKFLPKLSQNLLEILDKEEYFDVTIEVGNDPSNTKFFRSHTVILSYRSLYLQKILSTVNNDDEINNEVLTHIKLPNISPDIFQIILRYIYGGRLSLKDYDTSDVLKILVAASELDLEELIPHTQFFLIENNSSWIEQNFDLVYQTSLENSSFVELQKYCDAIISNDPDKLLESLNYSSTSESLMVTLLKSENIQMEEIQVWKHVIKWGLAQNPELSSDPTNYSKDDFNVLKKTLQRCIPLVRFHLLSSKEFSGQVLPYRKILPKELYMNLLKIFLDNNYKPNKRSEPQENKETHSKSIKSKIKDSNININNNNINASNVNDSNVNDSNVNDSNVNDLNVSNINFPKVPPKVPPKVKDTRFIDSNINDSRDDIYVDHSDSELSESENVDQNVFDSVLISTRHVELISKWIDKLDITGDSTPSPYEFRLLFRGSRDGFTPKKFHKICDDHSDTVSIIKVQGSDEILGGYNPTVWKSDGSWSNTKDSFIFSFENKKSINNYILSRVVDERRAVNNGSSNGPSFGNENLHLHRKYLGREFSVYCNHNKNSYETSIGEAVGYLGPVEELEVFRVYLKAGPILYN